MKKSILLSNLFLLFAFIGYCQSVTIGTQVWSTKNLDVSTFRNGDPIPQGGIFFKLMMVSTWAMYMPVRDFFFRSCTNLQNFSNKM